MELTFTARLKQAWNAFLNNKDPTTPEYRDIGASYSVRPDRPRLTPGNERSIITSIVNRIAMDAAAVKIRHVRLNQDEQYIEDINSSLNNILSLEANVDQASRAFIQDIVMSMLDEGVVAVVPVDASAHPRFSSTFNIYTMRTAKIVQWYPQHVKVRAYVHEFVTVGSNLTAFLSGSVKGGGVVFDVFRQSIFAQGIFMPQF